MNANNTKTGFISFISAFIDCKNWSPFTLNYLDEINNDLLFNGEKSLRNKSSYLFVLKRIFEGVTIF